MEKLIYKYSIFFCLIFFPACSQFGQVNPPKTVQASPPSAPPPVIAAPAKPITSRAPVKLYLADYDAELRLPDGHVDTDKMLTRLKELGVTAYYWLIWHAATDWDDLKTFLPRAAAEGIDVWVYLTPPSELHAASYGYSEPFRQDYTRWAQEIAKLSATNPNLTGWMIDDFYYNLHVFTPAYLSKLRQITRASNPKLKFYPVLYFHQLSQDFVDKYKSVIDGIEVAYPVDADEIEEAWSLLNGVPFKAGVELSFPYATSSQAGDYVQISASASILPQNRHVIRFQSKDTYTGATTGFRFKQLLVDGQVAWEEDLAGGKSSWKDVSLDVAPLVKGKTNVNLTFRLIDKKPVGNFAGAWRLRKLITDGIRPVAALDPSSKWNSTSKGAFLSNLGIQKTKTVPRYHIPFIVMTAAKESEFKMRHGEPASPERIAGHLAMCLDEMQKGKCEGVVLYCLDKTENSQQFPLIAQLFQNARRGQIPTR